MPTPWKRSPEELHKTYIANTLNELLSHVRMICDE